MPMHFDHITHEGLTEPDPDAAYEEWLTDQALRHDAGPHDADSCPICIDARIGAKLTTTARIFDLDAIDWSDPE